MIVLYLDPGSGSFLIQLLIAAVVGGGIAIAASWSKIKRLFRKKEMLRQIMTRMTSSQIFSFSFVIS